MPKRPTWQVPTPKGRDPKPSSPSQGQFPAWQEDHLEILGRFMPRARLQAVRRYLRGHPFTRRQQQCLQTLSDILDEDLAPYHKRSLERLDPSEEAHYETANERYRDAMIQAVKAGLEHHPLVARWIEARRGAGYRETLQRARRARFRPETGVKPRITKQELDLEDEITRRREQGQSWERIRRALIQRGALSRKSRQAFHRQITRLGLR